MECTMPSPALAAADARELLDIWERVSRQHVSLATGCACGVGGVTLQLQDFEQDIADYVLGQAERGRRQDVVNFLRGHAQQADGRWSIALLLAALFEPATAPASDELAEFILTRLGKTLRSFAKLHG
jgi:hypothetical protein